MNTKLDPIKAASHHLTNERAFELIIDGLSPKAKVLDMGAGSGHLARRVGMWFAANGGGQGESAVIACDVDAKSFLATEVPFRKVDLNRELPFDDATFDLIYSIEVVEHLQRPYDFLEECFRILQPGGRLIVSTPNILHIGSRVRFLLTGFFDLYQPPSTNPANAGRLCGHIMPLHAAYYYYGLRRAGFTEVHYAVDKIKKGAQLARWLLLPLLMLAQGRFRRDVQRYDLAVYMENQDVIHRIGDTALMTSRSLMFVARKAADL